MRVAIEQNPEKLLAMDPASFDYDLEAPGFLQYFKDRTGYQINVIDSDPTKTGKILENNNWNYRKNSLYNPAIEESRRHVLITRAKIQDCWQIWIQPGYQQQRERGV
jgi:hypothetical protein